MNSFDTSQSTHLDGLNPAQRQAVEYTKGPLMIIAGAGTGKTRVITHRIVNLIQNGVLPEQILAVTFTNKAAQEMRERVERLLSSTHSLSLSHRGTGLPFMSTFHSLGVRILRENSGLLDRQKHFSIFDRDDSLSVIKQAIKDLALDPKRFAPGALLSLISRQKGEAVSLKEFKEERAGDFFSKVLASVWERYESALAREHAYDFDDLLLKTVEFLSLHPDVAARYQERWTYMHVDEYQDTNIVQYRLMHLLTGPAKNICVVGDHDQCIYTWRSADMRNMTRFEEAFPNTHLITLEENYRSTQTILSAANESIRLNTVRKEKELFTNGPDGEKIKLYTALDEGDEARFIADTSKELIQKGNSPNSIAVLFRANFQSRALEEAFLSLGIPYQLVGVRFFERKEIKDMLSYIHASLNPNSATHLSRIINVPARGVGKVTLLKILAGQEDSLPASMKSKLALFRDLLKRIRETALTQKPSETIKFILKESGIEKELRDGSEEDLERLLNIRELASLATRYDDMPAEEGVHLFLEEAALASDQDAIKNNDATVKLMTIHAAKGLEFDTVFIGGLEEGLFPSERSEMRELPEEREEERRLFYVAVTRAKKQLYLSYCHIRTIFGSPTVNVASRFITDIDSGHIEEITPVDQWRPETGRKGLLDIDF